MAALLFLFSACALVDTPEDKGNNPFKEDYLVGFFVHFEVFNEKLNDYEAFPSNNFGDEEGLFVYYTVEGGQFPVSRMVIGGDFFDLYISIADSGVAPDGKLGVTASLRFTHELLGSILYLSEVYRTNDNSYYAVPASSGYYLSGAVEMSVSMEQKLTSTVKLNGKTEETTYTGKVTLSFKLIDNLVSARILEFDANHNLLKTSVVDLHGDSLLDYIALKSCEYVVIEEEYEIAASDSLEGQKGEKYTQRSLISKKTGSQFHSLRFPLGNGLTNSISLRIGF